MSLLETPAKFDAEKALRVQVGLMSPLWLPVAGAAAMGFAAWNFTRWMRLATPEGAAEVQAAAEEVVTEAEALAEPVVEPVVEAIAETVALVPEPVTEEPLPVIEPEEVTAPIEAVVEAQAEVAETVADVQAEAVETVVEAQAEVVKAAVAVPKAARKAAAVKKPAARKPRPTAH